MRTNANALAPFLLVLGACSQNPFEKQSFVESLQSMLKGPQASPLDVVTKNMQSEGFSPDCFGISEEFSFKDYDPAPVQGDQTSFRIDGNVSSASAAALLFTGLDNIAWEKDSICDLNLPEVTSLSQNLILLSEPHFSFSDAKFTYTPPSGGHKLMGAFIFFFPGGVYRATKLFRIEIQEDDTEIFEFAVIGDYGAASDCDGCSEAELDEIDQADVANLVDSWNPEFILTVGDNNYPDGEKCTIDVNIGRYYSDYIRPYNPTSLISGCPNSTPYGQIANSGTNRFFPSIGNHDWHTSAGSNPYGPDPYLRYFDLPKTSNTGPPTEKAYYEKDWGPLHLISIDSNRNKQPDGVSCAVSGVPSSAPCHNSDDTIQYEWFLDITESKPLYWRIAFFHHASYSSGWSHQSQEEMQWNFAARGVDMVLTGHDHIYERLTVRDPDEFGPNNEAIPYFVNGVGGRGTTSSNVSGKLPESECQWNRHGAQKIRVVGESMLISEQWTTENEHGDELSDPRPVEKVIIKRDMKPIQFVNRYCHS